MCDFITAVLPSKSRVEELSQIFAAHQRTLKPLENASIQRQLRPGETYFYTTRGHCDCGTVLGSLESYGTSRSRAEQVREREVRKRRQQGWGDAKIESWLRQRVKSEDRGAARRLENLAAWTGLLEAVRGSGAAPYVGLLIHQYDGPLSGEVQLRSREHVRIADVTGEFLTAMERDVLYEFRV
jgi:hypothetical protein